MSHIVAPRTRPRGRLLVVACALLASIGVFVPSASAVSRYTVWQGSPGALIKTSRVLGHPTYAGVASKVGIEAAWVNRSPATTGQQTVVYEYRVFTWNGREWVRTAATYGLSRTIPSGQQTAVLDGNGWGGSIDISAYGFVAVELAVAFYSGSQMLGRFNIWHDQAGDYTCVRSSTMSGSCTVYSAGYLQLR